ncbi:unnamed protein product, partial [Rotaria sordida]
MAYIIGFEQANVVVSPANMSVNSVVIGRDDIYSAEDSSFYETFLLNHYLLHPQHVLDYIANQTHKDALTEFRHDVSFSSTLHEPIGESFDIEWSEGEETWLTHDELPQQRARLDLKWCLDQFFGWNVSHPSLGQLVTANIFGTVHMAYIIGFEQANVVVSPADMSGNSVVIGHEDIYSAEDSPFYEKFLRNHSLLHSQHVLDYIANQKRKNALTEFRHDVSFSSALQESIGEYFDIEWPEGKETWLIHDELPQRDQFLT